MPRITVVAGIALIIVTVVAVFATRYAMSQQAEEYAVKVNGSTISEHDIDVIIAQNERHLELIRAGVVTDPGAERPTTDRALVAAQQIEKRLLEGEAERRGLGCSTAEVDALVGQQMALADQPTVLTFAAIRGLTPVEYISAPDAERTPDAQSVVDAYWADSEVRAGYESGCVIGKLYQSLDDPTPDTPKTNEDRNQAIEALEQGLLEAATIERAPGY